MALAAQGRGSKLFFAFLGVSVHGSQRSCELTTWFIAAEKQRMVYQEVKYQVHGPRLPLGIACLPLPFPCLTITMNSQVCSNNPSFTLLCFFFLLTKRLDIEEGKWIGG